MDGKPLYEYARENKPLPRAIPVRECNVEIDLIDFTPAQVTPGDGGHEYKWPAERLDAEKKDVFRKLTQMVHDAGGSDEPEIDLTAPEYPEVSEKTGLRPAAFKIRMTVSSGTYVRSIVHDIGLALGCGAHVVLLQRTRQGEFVLDAPDVERVDAKRAAEDAEEAASAEAAAKAQADAEEEAMNHLNAAAAQAGSAKDVHALAAKPGRTTACVPWSVFETAIAKRDERKEALAQARKDGMSAEEIEMNFPPRGEELEEWEEKVLETFHPVPVPVVRDSKSRAEGVYFRR